VSVRYRRSPSYDEYDDPRYGYARGYAEYPTRTVRRPVSATRLKRSHAAIPVAVVVLIIGLLLGKFSILVPGLLGLLLLYTALSFLSTRLNPFSVGFYLTVKPSWTAIGVLVLLGFVLLYAAYAFYLSGFGPILPGLHHLP
jgi:hypothetical protein